ncbi:hypothetical protein [Dactylosporangium matsuzakiense]|uniref:Uncharacterized protein n=1 Tax=Dactylosporangium matsuzakiense TaxID=53360 RepID=A0A9W6KQ40_9ACTN|nr:hypothetical protein [Dactylosporangium matsuzakiense]UWZ47724.1 hypothetical protein Dmats_15760 [Dactylosporangium matsuzakiense]GLL06106.1 hypothetical protein GCM10017581_078540 [Dactylosporangium matsuzakiense]
MERGNGVTPAPLQPPLPAALQVLSRWAPALCVEATAVSAPIQWLSPWDDPPPPEQAARYARLASLPRAVRVLRRPAVNRFGVAQPERVAELASWLTEGAAAVLAPGELARLGELVPYIAELLVTWIAVDPDVLLLDAPGEPPHLLHRTGDRTTRFSLRPAAAPPAPAVSLAAVAELLAFVLPITPVGGVDFTVRTAAAPPGPGLEPVEERRVRELLYRAVFIHATAIAHPGQELGRLAARLLRDLLDTAVAAAGAGAAWHASPLPAPLCFAAEGTPATVAVIGSAGTAYVTFPAVAG